MKYTFTRNVITRALVLALPVLASLPALSYAQDEQQDNAQDKLERIEVTAQKRTQSIVDVPASISAFDGKRLEELGLSV